MDSDNRIIEYNGVLSSSTLHIIAMVSMLLDHVGAVVFPELDWMRLLGRLAFPIYCFMLAEGFRRTSNATKYLQRLLIFGLISEIPFDLAFYEFNYWRHQNVYWNLATSLVALICIKKLEQPGFKYKFLQFLVIISAFMVATFTFSDYYGFGVLLVVSFYQFPGKDIRDKIMQLLLMVLINAVLLGGPQAFAIIATPFIWLYSGERGITSKPFKYFCYAFYPLHLLILGLIRMFLL